MDKAYISEKKVIIYGDRKEQKDFLYIFDWIKFSYIISPDGRNDSDRKIFPCDSLKKEAKESILVIVCWKDRQRAVKDMQRFGLIYDKQYIFADDIFYMLDRVDVSYVRTKQIYIWGLGETQEHLEDWLQINEYDIMLQGYVDNNENSWGKKKNGRDILSPADFFAKNDTYLIVASIYYSEIKLQLEEHGRQEDKDFGCFCWFENRPSKMLKKTMYDYPIKASRKCTIPFERLTYTCYGNYPCCVSWVDYPVGSPVVETPQQSWNSIVMKLYQLSVENKTYSFCKKGVCGILPPNSENIEEDVSYTYNCQKEEYPRLLVLGLDNSCNLHCESCRDKVFFAQGRLLEKRKQFANQLVDSKWLDKVEQLFFSVDGEVFASEVDRIILTAEAKRKNVHILTNGTLLNENNWNLLENKYESIDISISIDAASEETYAKLRRGGNWKILQQNLHMLSEKRLEKKIRYIDIRMVVQRKNYKEMRDFVLMGKKFHFDKVIFSRINNYGTYSDAQFREISLIDRENQLLDPELKFEFMNEIFRDEIVDISDFNIYRKRTQQ